MILGIPCVEITGIYDGSSQLPLAVLNHIIDRLLLISRAVVRRPPSLVKRLNLNIAYELGPIKAIYLNQPRNEHLHSDVEDLVRFNELVFIPKEIDYNAEVSLIGNEGRRFVESSLLKLLLSKLQHVNGLTLQLLVYSEPVGEEGAILGLVTVGNVDEDTGNQLVVGSGAHSIVGLLQGQDVQRGLLLH